MIAQGEKREGRKERRVGRGEIIYTNRAKRTDRQATASAAEYRGAEHKDKGRCVPDRSCCHGERKSRDKIKICGKKSGKTCRQKRKHKNKTNRKLTKKNELGLFLSQSNGSSQVFDMQ